MSNDRFSHFAATVADVDPLEGVISGVAVRYGVKVPRGFRLSEQVNAGAFSKQVADPARVSVLWQHDSGSPIGRATSLDDNEERLAFNARITRHEDVPEARKAMALLEEGVIDEISVGFEWQKWSELREEDHLTIVHERARLREFSLVTFGALGREARVLTVAAESSGLEVALYRAKFEALGN